MPNPRAYRRARQFRNDRDGGPGRADTASSTRQAVLYARVSSHDQEKKGFSLPEQQRSLREYATQRGFTVLREFVQDESARKPGRSGFDEMVAFLRSHPGCCVLVEEHDRLYRNFTDMVTLDDMGVELHFVREGVVISKDSHSSEKFAHTIKVAMAKNYIDQLREKIRRGMDGKARSGRPPGPVAVGYMSVTGPSGKKEWVPDPVRAPLITKLFERWASGNYSILDLTKWAQQAGLRSKRGTVLLKSRIYYILCNEAYAGRFEWDGKMYEGTYKTLVTRELWDRAQAVLERRSEGHVRKVRRHDHAFGGLVTCGHCGCSFVGEIKKGRLTYYHCTFNRGECPSKRQPWVREEVLEAQFGDALKMLVIDEEIVSWMAQALRESHLDEKRFHDEAVSRLQADANRLETRLHALYDDKLDGRITAGFHDEKATKLKADLSRVEGDIAKHKRADRSYLEEGARLLELVQDAHRLYVKQKPAEKRRLLEYLHSNATWKDGELHVTFKQPFDRLVVANVEAEKVKGFGGDSEALRSVYWR